MSTDRAYLLTLKLFNLRGVGHMRDHNVMFSRPIEGVKVAVRTRISRHERHRRRLGYSVTGLASAIDRTHAYVSRVEAGEISASPWYRSTVSELLQVPESELFDLEGRVR